MIRALIVLLALAAAADPAHACVWNGGRYPVDVALEKSELAFEGTAQSVAARQLDQVSQNWARIRVNKHIKGPATGPWVTVWTEGSSGMCGYLFQVGVRRTYAVRKLPDGRWWADPTVMRSFGRLR